jgi:hypothetical protein
VAALEEGLVTDAASRARTADPEDLGYAAAARQHA